VPNDHAERSFKIFWILRGSNFLRRLNKARVALGGCEFWFFLFGGLQATTSAMFYVGPLRRHAFHFNGHSTNRGEIWTLPLYRLIF
jgi:hypothetical protein